MDYKQYLLEREKEPVVIKYGEKIKGLIEKYPKLKDYKYELWYNSVMFGDEPINTVLNAIQPNGGIEFPGFEDILLKSAVSIYTSRIEQAKKILVVAIGNEVNGAKHDNPDIKTVSKKITIYFDGKLYTVNLFHDDKRDQLADYSKLVEGRTYLASLMLSNSGKMYPVDNPFIKEAEPIKIDTMQVMESIRKDVPQLVSPPTEEDTKNRKEFYVIGVISRPNPMIAEIQTSNEQNKSGFKLTIPNGSDLPEGSICLVVGTIVESKMTKGDFVMMESYHIVLKQLVKSNPTNPVGSVNSTQQSLPTGKVMDEKQVRSIFD
jgi:hypothetical protein